MDHYALLYVEYVHFCLSHNLGPIMAACQWQQEFAAHLMEQEYGPIPEPVINSL